MTAKHEWLLNEFLGHHAEAAPRPVKENPMKPQISSRSLRNRISNISHGWRCRSVGFSGRPALKQVLPNAADPPQRTIGPGFFLRDLLDVNAELPYTTVVEGLEEFLYQSELQPHA